MSVADYRREMLARKARAAGCTVAELLARQEAEAARHVRVWEIRADRRSAWREIERKAMAHGRVWVVLDAPRRP